MARKTTKQQFSLSKPWNPVSLRLLRGPYTQGELAEIIHVRLQTVQEWEAGTTAPSMPSLRQLLIHYNTWTRDLAGAALDWLTLAGAPIRKGNPWRTSKSTSNKRAAHKTTSART